MAHTHGQANIECVADTRHLATRNIEVKPKASEQKTCWAAQTRMEQTVGGRFSLKQVGAACAPCLCTISTP